MKIQEVVHALEAFAHPALQEGYDNAGLITGDRNSVCTGALISLDVTETIVHEAIAKKCNLIIAHHPIIFRGIKRLTGANEAERTIIAAIRNEIAIYAIHTNLDNVLHGVNGKVAAMLHLQQTQVLAEKQKTLRKMVTFVPEKQAEQVRQALFDSGGGAIGDYDECSFNLRGTGTFKPLEGADPFSGTRGERFSGEEIRIEVVFPFYREKKLIAALKQAHPYEEVAYYITELTNTEKETGSGIVGKLGEPMEEESFLAMIQQKLQTKVLRHTELLGRPVEKVAFCGGAGIFLLPDALAAGADVFITSDVKYHEFFDADGKIVLIDAGHFETEQYTIELLAEYLQNKFANFAVLKTEHKTNPIRYYT